MKLYKDDFSELENAVKWCNDFIIEYQKNGDFDPFTALTGNENKRQKIYVECVNFLYSLESLTDDFKDIRKKYL
jgi:hypothetical protein